MRSLNVRWLISASAVGSLKENIKPCDIVIPDQFIDRTFAREKSFFGTGMVAHVSMAHPVNARLGDWCQSACELLDIKMQRGGTYLVMEGPQFSTLAESELYRQWGCDVIGMTNMPEAKLAREAEMPYCTVAMVTDFDCWHPEHDNVDVATVINVLTQNAGHAKELVRAVAKKMNDRPAICPSGDDRALDAALVTHESAREPTILKKLDAVAGRRLRET